jgi:hypothetical protein
VKPIRIESSLKRALLFGAAASAIAYLLVGSALFSTEGLLSVIAAAIGAGFVLIGLGRIRSDELKRSATARRLGLVHPAVPAHPPMAQAPGLRSEPAGTRGYVEGAAPFHVEVGIPWYGSVSTENADKAFLFVRRVFGSRRKP